MLFAPGRTGLEQDTSNVVLVLAGLHFRLPAPSGLLSSRRIFPFELALCASPRAAFIYEVLVDLPGKEGPPTTVGLINISEGDRGQPSYRASSQASRRLTPHTHVGRRYHPRAM